jgi:hypothetical protein
MSMNVEAEIRDLKRRLGEQVKGVHRSLLGFQERTEERFDRVEGRLGKVESGLDKVEGRLGKVETEVRALRKELPKIVGDAVREVLRPGDR